MVFRVICLSLVFSLSFPHPLFANPEGATVAAGQASVDEQGSKLNVRQSTQKAIIDWRSFNIEQNEHTQFYQPNSKSITLNRINQGSPSQIDGKLSANGRLILVNPDGVFFSGSSSVDVAGLVATSAGISNHDFMSGKMNFGIAGNPAAKIINEGRITARDAGLVGFVAPHVENRGVIEARLGSVQLSSGETFVMDMAGDGIIGVAVEKNSLQNQIAKNSGRISADGGSVQLTAAAARSHVNSLVTNTGTIEARSVGKKNGKIVLSAAGSHGSSKTGASKTINEGRLDVSGKKKNERGGDVQVLGDKVELSGTSRIDASGTVGGGKAYIGGDYQGGGAMQRAFETVVSEQSQINVSALQSGHAGKAIIWSDLDTYFKGDILATGGRYSGDGGFVEVSGKRYLDFQGTVDTTAAKGVTGMLLLDPTDIVISNAASANVNGATPFSPNADDVVSNLNVTTLQTALASTNVTVQTRATGSQQGNITVSDPIAWSANRTLTLDAHNDITVNAAITARNTLTFNAGGDVILNANLIEHASGANLVFQPKTLSNSIGIAGGAGTLNLSTSDLGFIQSGFNNITIGAATGTGNINANAYTWNAPLTLITSGAGTINIDGAQNVGNRSMTLTSRNVNINAALTGGTSGTLTIQPDANAVTVGIGDGQAGTFNLTNAELANITDGWGTIALGRTSGTSAMNIAARTWTDPLSLRNSSGVMNINGTQTMGANNLTIQSSNLNLASDLSGTGTLTIQAGAAGTTTGIGDGQTGTLNLTNAELARILNGWTLLNFGHTNATGAMNVGAYTWNDPVGLRSATGVININGTQTMGANALTFTTANLNIGADLSGTGALVIQSNAAATTTGIGDGQAGTLNLTNAELARVLNGWSSISFGRSDSTAAMNVGGYTWNDSVTFQSRTGAINVNGTQNTGSNNLTFTTRSINLASSLNGSGTLTIQPEGNTSMGVGSAATGTLLLNDAALNQISDGWGLLQFGSTGSTAAVNIAARTWSDSVRFRSGTGLMTVLGDQNVGTNNLTFQTDSNLALNGNLSGTGTLRFWQTGTGTTIGLAGGTGTLNIDATELGRIQDGWGLIRFGNETANNTGAMNINGHNFLDSVHIYTDTGIVTFGGAVDVGANDLTVTSRAAVNINSALSGAGTLSFVPEANNSTVGLAGGAGSLNLTAASLNNISDGWSQLLIGRNDNTGAMAINAYNNWRDNVKFMTAGGAITVAGAQNFAANEAIFETNGNMAINAAMAGTGNLSIYQATAATTMGLAGGAGTVALTAAELNNISNGWNSITFGRTDSTGLLTANAYTWNDSLILRAGTGNMTIAGAQNMGANNLTIQANGNPAINAALAGTGTLTFEGGTAATTIGLAGGAGTLALTAAELNNITNGWSDVYFGSANGTGAITANAYSGWNDHVTFRSDTGGITIAGTQNFGPNNFTLLTNADPSINAALSGTGTLSFRPATTSTSMGFGGGTGTYNLGTSEISNILNGWSQITAGRSDLAADLNIGTSVWNDPVHFLTSADILLNGTVTSTEASGTSIVLASAAGDFINNAGASGINPGGGRYLVYSTSPANNTLGGLTGFNKLYNKTYAGYAPGSVSETGNIHLFSIAPTLTVTANDVSREYGLANSLTATITGFIDGDTVGTATTGTAGLTTSGTIGSDVGSYSITAALGSLASAMGYQFTTFVDGLLDITPATLTVTANDKTREYGLANPTLDGVITGLRNGDADSVVSGLGYSTAALTGSNVGNYAISASGASAANYIFSYIDGNLSVTSAPLTVIAEDKQRQQGQANPAFTALISGFRNGDTESVLSGLDFSTPATPSSAAGNYAITPFGITAMNYHVLSYVDGNLEVTALPSQGGGSLPSVVEAAYFPSYAETESIQTNIFNTTNEISQEVVSEEDSDTTGQKNENEPTDEAKNQELEKNDSGNEFIKNNIKGLVIQAGIFNIKDNAVSLAKKLSPTGDVFIQETSIGEKKAWRVGVGPFSDKSLVDRVFSRVQNLVGSNIFVVKLGSHSGS